MIKLIVTQNGKTKEIAAEAGKDLLHTLRAAGYDVKAPCGGNGTCKQCRVHIDGAEALACRTLVEKDCAVLLPDTDKIEVVTKGAVNIAPCGEGLGLAVDIGTTTVAAFLYDLPSGALLGVESARNAQRAYGSDVISRIQYSAKDGGLEELHDAIVNQLSGFIDALCRKLHRKRSEITRISIAANTVMEHIFASLSPVSIGIAPFTTLSLFGDTRPASEIFAGLAPEAELYLCPALAGYVGGDITAGIFSAGAMELSGTTLFIDIGTNGEMGLGDSTGFTCCATAAGPAFEGAEIECGMDGTNGAISKVAALDGDISYSVIGGGEAKGICGSGLIDALAALLDLGVIEQNGRMVPAEEAPEKLKSRIRRDESGTLRFYFTDTIFLSANDVRQLQLAKAAIRGGIETLLETRGRSYADVNHLLIAGGFGAFMDVRSACRIGLLPPALGDRTRHIGNSAGAGAALALDREKREALAAVSVKCDYLELSSSALFMEKYIEGMAFEVEE